MYVAYVNMAQVGAWRSPVAHLHGVEGVEGANPFAPTISFRHEKTPGVIPWGFYYVNYSLCLTRRGSRSLQ